MVSALHSGYRPDGSLAVAVEERSTVADGAEVRLKRAVTAVRNHVVAPSFPTAHEASKMHVS